jgi:pyridoxamine 5'-phosphate oxidase
MPITKIHQWLEREKKLGSQFPDRMVLATAGKNAIPHCRIVAIREITTKGILFFTQRGTRKTVEMSENPHASMTCWLPLQQREIMIDGVIEPLEPQENDYYWSLRPKDRQLKFSAYAPTSGQSIASLAELEVRFAELSSQYQNRDVPMSDYYCGYRLIPHTIIFYTLDDDYFSEIIKFTYDKRVWQQQLLSP